MKKSIVIIVIMLILNLNLAVYGQSNDLLKEDINAQSAILINGETGEILFEKNMHKKMYPASTTKILTGILALEQGDLDKIVTVDDKTPFEIDGTHIALEPGEELRFKELLNAMLIESANDAALVLAKDMAGSVEDFSKLMNEKAKEIGAINSNFVNPNGLPDEDHISTAYDLAMIAKYGMKNKQFRNIVKNYQYSIEATNMKNERRNMQSVNKLLYSNQKINLDGNYIDIKYDGAIGVKTGYTKDAGNCLVSAAKRDGKMLISVVLKSQGTNLWIDTHKLLNHGFNDFDKKILGFKNEFVKNIDINNGDKDFVTGVISEDVSVSLKSDMKNDISKKIKINDNIRAPIEKGEVLGSIEYINDEKIIESVNIVSAEEISLIAGYEKTLSASLFNDFNIWWIVIILFLFLILRINILRKRRKKRKRKKRKI